MGGRSGGSAAFGQTQWWHTVSVDGIGRLVQVRVGGTAQRQDRPVLGPSVGMPPPTGASASSAAIANGSRQIILQSPVSTGLEKTRHSPLFHLRGYQSLGHRTVQPHPQRTLVSLFDRCQHLEVRGRAPPGGARVQRQLASQHRATAPRRHAPQRIGGVAPLVSRTLVTPTLAQVEGGQPAPFEQRGAPLSQRLLTRVDRRSFDHLDSVVDGEHFMRAIIQHLEDQRRRGRHGDLFINDQALHWYVKWDWVRHGSEVELKINNTDMVRAGRLKTTKVAIDVALALKMGWLLQKENQDYTLGPNLHWEYIERELNKPWLRDIEKGIPNFQRKRDWIDLPDERGVNAFWRVTQNKVLHLSMSVHWRFIHLNQASRAVIGSPMRTLHVYSDIGGSSIVGGQVTDLLREVQYKQQGRGTVYFEPLHVQYLPLRNTFVDQIESQIAETNGQLVRFAGPTPTILTLHFKRDL